MPGRPSASVAVAQGPLQRSYFRAFLFSASRHEELEPTAVEGADIEELRIIEVSAPRLELNVPEKEHGLYGRVWLERLLEGSESIVAA